MTTIAIINLDNAVVPSFVDPAEVREFGREKGLIGPFHIRGRLPQPCINAYLRDVLGLTVVEVDQTNDVVTIWAHNTDGDHWYAAPWPDSLTDTFGTWEYPGEPYWIASPEGLHNYIHFCLRNGYTVRIYVGG